MQNKKNKNCIKILLTIFLLHFFVVQNVWAAPSVLNVSGTISDGQNIDIIGWGFGMKMNALPIKFDNFEDGINDVALNAVDNSWKIYNSGGVKYSDVLSHAGNFSVGSHITDGESFQTNYYTYSVPQQEMYISYWWRNNNADANDKTVIKMTRLNSSVAAGGGGIYNGAGNTSFGGTYNLASNSGPYLAYNNGVTFETLVHPTSAASWSNYFPPPLKNAWFRVDLYKKLSTPGMNDGKIETKIYELDSAIDNAAMTRASGYSFLLDTVLLGTMDGWDGVHDYEIYLDDMYIDSTQARVELCDNVNWSARTHCEIQIATTWNANGQSVSFDVNQGSFADNSSQYLYVVNADGDVNANGFPITFGIDASDVISPSAPGGLGVQ